MSKIIAYSLADLTRSKWIYFYLLFFLLSGFGLLYLSNDLSQAIVSLMNIILILCPLISLMFGIFYFYNSREFTLVLLAQPIPRWKIFMGQFTGLSLTLSLCFMIGLGVPFVLYGLLVSALVFDFLTLIISGLSLTIIFSAMAFLVGLLNDNRIQGFGVALGLWLFLAVIYDGIFLISLLVFDEYPLESFSIGMTLFNPIDLSRILVMLKLDMSALFGYTGAVYRKFFGTTLGMFISLSVLFLWIVWPTLAFLRVARRKDF